MYSFMRIFLGMTFALALPATAAATDNGFGNSYFAGTGHPAFSDPVPDNIADADARAVSAIEPAAGLAAGEETMPEKSGSDDTWAQDLPESLVEIKTAPVVIDEDIADTQPPVF